MVERTFRAESGRALATLARRAGRPGRGGGRRAGGVRRGAAHLAGPGHPRQPRRLGHHHRPQPGTRPCPTRGAAPPGRRRPPCASTPAPEPPDCTPVPDDQLRLIFTCCHPALAPAAQVALTLRLVCGLQVPEIARAFLQPEATVAQRLTRAKAQDPRRRHPLPGAARPPPARAAAAGARVHLPGLHRGLRGHRRRRADPPRAVRRGASAWAGWSSTLMPDEPEAAGLLALLLLQDSRRAARLSPDGELVLLGRPGPRRAGTATASPRPTTWLDPGAAPPAARARTSSRRPSPPPTPGAPTWEATDWPAIAGLYAALAAGGALAGGRAQPGGGGGLRRRPGGGPGRARRRRRRPPPGPGAPAAAAARADLLRRLGRADAAAAAYRDALGAGGQRPGAGLPAPPPGRGHGP